MFAMLAGVFIGFYFSRYHDLSVRSSSMFVNGSKKKATLPTQHRLSRNVELVRAAVQGNFILVGPCLSMLSSGVLVQA